jgi:hypothetical protein
MPSLAQTLWLIAGLFITLGCVFLIISSSKRIRQYLIRQYKSVRFYNKALPLSNSTVEALHVTKDWCKLHCSQCPNPAQLIGKLKGHGIAELFCPACARVLPTPQGLQGSNRHRFLLISDYQDDLTLQVLNDRRDPLRQTTLEMEKVIHEIEQKNAYDPFNL